MPVSILTNAASVSPNIVLDNIYLRSVAKVVQVDGGATLLQGTSGINTIDRWATGRRYNGSTGSAQTGNVTAPARASALLNSKAGAFGLYGRSRLQYESLSAS